MGLRILAGNLFGQEVDDAVAIVVVPLSQGIGLVPGGVGFYRVDAFDRVSHIGPEAPWHSCG